MPLKICFQETLEGAELERRPRPQKIRTISKTKLETPNFYFIAKKHGGTSVHLQSFGKKLWLDFEQSAVKFRRPTIFVLGADPQTGNGNPEMYGGFCSTWGVLNGDIKISGKFSKMREISRVKEKPFSPSSGETGNRKSETGQKCSRGSRGLQVLKVWWGSVVGFPRYGAL